MNHRSVELDIFSHATELISVFEFHANIAALVNFDIINELGQNFPCQFVDVLIFEKCCQKRTFRIHAVFQLFLLVCQRPQDII